MVQTKKRKKKKKKEERKKLIVPEPGRIVKERRNLQRAIEEGGSVHEVIECVVVCKDKNRCLDMVGLLTELGSK